MFSQVRYPCAMTHTPCLILIDLSHRGDSDRYTLRRWNRSIRCFSSLFESDFHVGGRRGEWRAICSWHGGRSPEFFAPMEWHSARVAWCLSLISRSESTSSSRVSTHLICLWVRDRTSFRNQSLHALCVWCDSFRPRSIRRAPQSSAEHRQVTTIPWSSSLLPLPDRSAHGQVTTTTYQGYHAIGV